jgi:hypothetical protein
MRCAEVSRVSVSLSPVEQSESSRAIFFAKKALQNQSHKSFKLERETPNKDTKTNLLETPQGNAPNNHTT